MAEIDIKQVVSSLQRELSFYEGGAKGPFSPRWWGGRVVGAIAAIDVIEDSSNSDFISIMRQLKKLYQDANQRANKRNAQRRDADLWEGKASGVMRAIRTLTAFHRRKNRNGFLFYCRICKGECTQPFNKVLEKHQPYTVDNFVHHIRED